MHLKMEDSGGICHIDHGMIKDDKEAIDWVQRTKDDLWIVRWILTDDIGSRAIWERGAFGPVIVTKAYRFKS